MPINKNFKNLAYWLLDLFNLCPWLMKSFSITDTSDRRAVKRNFN